MRAFLAVSILLVIVAVQIGCSGDGQVDGANQNLVSNIPPVYEFASAADALAEGNRVFDAGDTEKAIEVLSQAVALDPDLAEAHFKLGIAYALVEAQDDAVTESVENAAPTPKGKKPAEEKTNSEKSFEKAVTAYKKMLLVNADDDLAHFNLGLAYNKLNDDGDAAKSLREAVRLKPDDTQYQTELGAILIKLAKYHEAVGALKKAFELDPTNTKAEDLLERAEAGRKRIDFVSLPKNDNNAVKTEVNSNSNSVIANSNKSAETPKPKDSKPAVPGKTPS